jgi:hypothetical protein
VQRLYNPARNIDANMYSEGPLQLAPYALLDVASPARGTCHGSPTTPISIKPETFIMTRAKAADGHLADTVIVSGHRSTR